MEIVSVTFVQQYGAYSKGQIAGFVPQLAEKIIESGRAVATPVTKDKPDTAALNRRTAGLKGMVKKGG